MAEIIVRGVNMKYTEEGLTRQFEWIADVHALTIDRVHKAGNPYRLE